MIINLKYPLRLFRSILLNMLLNIECNTDRVNDNGKRWMNWIIRIICIRIYNQKKQIMGLIEELKIRKNPFNALLLESSN